jgi:predicted amidophosphoribosyltransferase
MSLTSLRTGGQLLAGVVWPLRCAGCGHPDEVLCGRCARWYSVPRWCPLPSSHPPEEGPDEWLDGVWGVSAYGGPVATLLSQWKERGRHDLTPRLALGLADAVHGCLADLAAAGVPVDDVLLVPVPTSARARRRRGADLVAELTGQAAGWLGEAVRVAPVLRLRRRVQDQAGLDAGQRRENLAGAFELAAGSLAGPGTGLAGRICLVIDDVVTTGATVREVVKVLAEAGAQPVGACCLSVTLRKHGVPIRADLH